MIGFLLRRFRWMLIGALGRELAKSLTQRHVDEAAQQLADRLPTRAVALAEAMPGDLLRTAGTAQVAGRTALRSARLSKDVVEFSRDLSQAPQRTRQRLTNMGQEWRSAVAEDDRMLRARLILATRGPTAATDVVLGGRSSWEDEPLPPVPASVDAGRRRSRRQRERLVGRVQRTYRPSRRPWR
jgi:hypothetical protein